MKVHPAADIFPIMSDEELKDLAADIEANGLIHPVIVDADDQVIDGRNRLAACKLAGVKPTFEKLNGQDPLAYIVSANLARRNLTKGQQAMAYAKIYPEGKRGAKRSSAAEGLKYERISVARSVLRLAEKYDAKKVVDSVLAGDIGLDEALDSVKAIENQASSAEAQAQERGRQLTQLRKIAPDLAEQVDKGKLRLNEAQAANEERRRQKESEQEVATRQLQEIMISLNPRKQSPEKFAEELVENINSKFWSRINDLDLSRKSVERCAEAFSAFAKMWAKKGEDE